VFGKKEEPMTATLARCPWCGDPNVSTTHMLAVVGTNQYGQEVLESKEVFACNICEFIRSVKSELWRQRQEVCGDR